MEIVASVVETVLLIIINCRDHECVEETKKVEVVEGTMRDTSCFVGKLNYASPQSPQQFSRRMCLLRCLLKTRKELCSK